MIYDRRPASSAVIVFFNVDRWAGFFRRGNFQYHAWRHFHDAVALLSGLGPVYGKRVYRELRPGASHPGSLSVLISLRAVNDQTMILPKVRFCRFPQGLYSLMGILRKAKLDRFRYSSLIHAYCSDGVITLGEQKLRSLAAVPVLSFFD